MFEKGNLLVFDEGSPVLQTVTLIREANQKQMPSAVPWLVSSCDWLLFALAFVLASALAISVFPRLW
jgi:hypothetical protein